MADNEPKPVPEARQCTDPEHELFGTVAVKAGDNYWGCMNPGVVNFNARGGFWAEDTQVAGWTPVVADPITPADPPADPPVEP